MAGPPGRVAGRLGAAALGMFLAGASLAQEVIVGPDAQATAPSAAVLVVDEDRLFAESAFGRASIAREENAVRALEAENSRIQSELVAEEQELTLLRKSLSAEEFSARAEAFDQKVERIRAEQDAKARDLSRGRDEDGKVFVAAVEPVLRAILEDRGAVVILGKGDVILALPAVDVTDEAIARIDQVLQAPQPEAAP